MGELLASRVEDPKRGTPRWAPLQGSGKGRGDQKVRRSAIWLAGQSLCRVFTTLWFDLKVYGLHHVPSHGGVLLVANHQSYLDPIAVAVRLRRPVSFFAKSELFENPIFGWLIRSLHAFPVRQGKGDRAAVQEAIERLKEGNVLNMYPEGSRSEDGEIAPIQSGAALIVRRAGVPIVPVVIDGSFEAWPKGRALFRAHPVRVVYGAPIDVDHLKGEQIVQLIDRTLRTMLADVRSRRSGRREREDKPKKRGGEEK